LSLKLSIWLLAFCAAVVMLSFEARPAIVLNTGDVLIADHGDGNIRHRSGFGTDLARPVGGLDDEGFAGTQRSWKRLHSPI
jgi:hypothetical protein